MKVRLPKFNIVFILVLTLIGLTPVLWFINRGDILINGLDTNFPLEPAIWFLKRFYVWNGSINSGVEFSSSTSGLFFHFIQLVPHLIGFSLKYVELFSLLFWFLLIVASAYLFSKTFVNSRIAQIVFVVFYTFNIYMFNTWENVKVSNLALVVGLPLFVSILELFRQKKLRKELFLAFIAISSVIVSGSGINPAYFIAILACLALYFAILTIFNRTEIKQNIFLFLKVNLIILLVNSFWLAPLLNELLLVNKVSHLNEIGLTNWLESLSVNTNIVNVIRLQGAWDWYVVDEFGNPLYIPYALNYFKNTWFILFSFVAPGLALLSLVFRKNSNFFWYCFFSVLLIIGIFLGAGSHEPTGQLYKFLTEKVVFFSFFRSPWYIFTPYLTLALSGLVALLIEKLVSIERFRMLTVLFGVILVAGQIVYCYPILTGKIFRPGRSDSFYVKFPDYVFEAEKWLKRPEVLSSLRIITYPDDQLEVFDWGYRGTESILGLFSSIDLVTPSFNYTSQSFEALLQNFYYDIKRGNYEGAFNTMPFLGVNTIFSKRDTSSISRIIDLKDVYLLNNSEITSIGNWDFIKTNKFVPPKIYSPKYLYLNFGNSNTFSDLAKTLDPESLVVNSGDSEFNKIQIDKSYLGTLISGRKTEHLLAKNILEYVVDTPESKKYIVLIKAGGLLNSDGLPTSVSIDGKYLEEVNITLENGFYRTSPVFFEKGERLVQVNFSETGNRIVPLDFNKVSGVHNLRKEEIPEDTSKTLVLYDTNAQNKHLKLKVDKFDPFLKYSLNFDYKYFYGNVPAVEIIQSTPNGRVMAYAVSVGASVDWEKRTFIIDPVDVDSDIEIIIKSGSVKEGRSKTFIENIRLEKIIDSELYLKSDPEKDFPRSRLDFTKINPTEYKLNIEDQGPVFIFAFENYSPSWIINGDDSIKDSVHFSANGGRNAWYFNTLAPKSTLVIYYYPQIIFRVGILLSISILALLSFYTIYVYVKK